LQVMAVVATPVSRAPRPTYSLRNLTDDLLLQKIVTRLPPALFSYFVHLSGSRGFPTVYSPLLGHLYFSSFVFQSQIIPRLFPPPFPFEDCRAPHEFRDEDCPKRLHFSRARLSDFFSGVAVPLARQAPLSSTSVTIFLYLFLTFRFFVAFCFSPFGFFACLWALFSITLSLDRHELGFGEFREYREFIGACFRLRGLLLLLFAIDFSPPPILSIDVVCSFAPYVREEPRSNRSLLLFSPHPPPPGVPGCEMWDSRRLPGSLRSRAASFSFLSDLP